MGAFWESFQTCVDTSDLPDVQKLSCLRSLLGGEATRSVEGLALTSRKYDAAMDILRQRYGTVFVMGWAGPWAMGNGSVLGLEFLGNEWTLNGPVLEF